MSEIAFDVSVSVTDADGNPVEGASVSLGDLASGVTDTSGTVTWTAVPGDTAVETVSLGVTADGYFSETMEENLARGTNEFSVGVADVAFDVVVSVTDADGNPVEGASVSLGDLAGGVTDASGMVTWTAVSGNAETETVTVTAEAEGYGPGAAEETLGREANEIVLSLTLLPFDLDLLVVDPDGAPVEGASVALQETGGSAVTDATGVLSWLDLPGDTVTVNAAAQGYKPFEDTLTLIRGANEETVSLERDPFGILASDACAGGATPLWIEDFQDGEANGWNVEAGWTIGSDPDDPENVVFVAAPDPAGPEASPQSPAQAHTALVDFEVGIPVVVRLDLRRPVGWARLGFGRSSFIPFTDAQGHDIAWAGYSVYIMAEDIALIRNDFTAGEEEVFGKDIAGTHMTLEMGEWVTFEWVIRDAGELLELWVDGVQVLSGHDAPPLGPGAFDVGATMFSPDARVLLDNVVVCQYTDDFVSAGGSEG